MVAPVTGMVIFHHTRLNCYLAWNIAVLVGFVPLMPLWGVYRRWDCSSRQIRTQMMLKKILLPVSLILAVTLITFSSIT